jgi:ketosteroid isomerase-like protein
MDRKGIEDLVRSCYQTRRAADVERVLTYFHPNAEFRIVGSDLLKPLTETVSGLANLRKLFQELFRLWDWSKFQIKTIHVDGNVVFVHSSGELHHTPSGKSVNTEILDRIAIKDGLIISFTEFADTHSIARVVGAAAA